MAKSRLPLPSLDQIVGRARILVVDDQEFPYEVLFRDAGYNITKWDNINSLGDLETGRYDIILLDLQGIGRDLSKDQGLGVLRHIKKTRPSQVVVAYSNSDWGVQYQPFFELADRVLPKSADYVDFKREVDDLLLEHFSVGFHVSRLSRKLADAGVEGFWAKRAVESAIKNRDPSKLTTFLRRRNVDSDDVQVIAGLAQVAIGVAQLWAT